MFDFVNYTFSGLMSVFGAIIGLAYPIILQSIQRIDEQYNSVRLASQFQQELVFRLFQCILFSNIIISTLAPFALYLGGLEYSIIVLMLQTLFVSALLFTSFQLFTVIRIYYNPRKLLNRLEQVSKKREPMMMADLKKADSTELIQYLQCIFDISVYGAKRSDIDTYFSALSDIYYYVSEYQRRSDTSNPVIYPNGFMKIFREITVHTTNNKEQTYYYSQNNITPLLYSSIFKHKISDVTYKYLWFTLNEVIRANNIDWFNQYWSSADQYYRFVLSPMMREEQDAINLDDQKRFYEQHIMVGALLVYNKKFSWLNNIMFFTNQSPPRYNLIPSTFRGIFEQIKYFGKYVSPVEFKLISAKYSFRGMNEDVNTDYYIYNEIKSYLALLIVRLFLVNDYNITYSNPMELPTAGSDISDNKYHKELIQSLIEQIELWYRTNDIYQVFSSKIPSKDDILKLLTNYIKKCDYTIKEISNNPEIDPKKIDKIKDKLHQEENRLKQLIVTENRVVSSDANTYDSKQWSLPYNYKLDENEILKGYTSISVNLEEVLIQILYREIERNYFYQFLNTKSLVDYSIALKDVMNAFKELKLNSSKHVILSLGVYLGSFESMYGKNDDFIYDSENYSASYCGIPIISLASNECSFLILNKTDMPYYEFQAQTEDGYEKINKYSNLYSNLDEISPAERILRLKYYLKYYYKEKFDYVRIKISYNLPLGSNGDMDIIKPFEKLKEGSYKDKL